MTLNKKKSYAIDVNSLYDWMINKEAFEGNTERDKATHWNQLKKSVALQSGRVDDQKQIVIVEYTQMGE